MKKIAKIGVISAAFLVAGLVIAREVFGPYLSGGDWAPLAGSAWLRIATVVVISAAFLVVAFVIITKTIHLICIAPEPRLDGTPAILSAKPRTEGDRTVLGRSWIARRHGIWQMYLEGDPFDIGFANATFTTDLLREAEDSLLRIVRVYIPSYIAVWLLGHYILIRNRRLPQYVPDEFKMEVLGLARGHRDYHPEIAPVYHRLLHYHAAHDIGHSVENTSLGDRHAVEKSLRSVSHSAEDASLAGCTSFAAWDGHVADGHLIAGRNCDNEMGASFDVNKIVMLVRPQEGHAFMSVSWAGWMGVATGMNDQRLYVSINAAHTADGRRIGTPVCLVVRQVLQYASSLEEAVRIIEKARLFVSDSFLIADGTEGKALVVEKSPGRMDVRRPEGDRLICSNHFLSEVFRDERVNRDFMGWSTSVARFERMRELVDRAAGRLNVPGAAEILRDRRGKDDLDVGNGNRSTVNPLIASHSVVADVTAGVLWVSASPHQLGAYVPFTVSDFDSISEDAVIPADPFLTGGGYTEHLRAEDLLARGGALLRTGRTVEAGGLLRESLELNPGFFRTCMLLAEVCLDEGNAGEARRLLDCALGAQPPFSRDREAIEALLRRAT